MSERVITDDRDGSKHRQRESRAPRADQSGSIEASPTIVTLFSDGLNFLAWYGSPNNRLMETALFTPHGAVLKNGAYFESPG